MEAAGLKCSYGCFLEMDMVMDVKCKNNQEKQCDFLHYETFGKNLLSDLLAKC